MQSIIEWRPFDEILRQQIKAPMKTLAKVKEQESQPDVWKDSYDDAADNLVIPLSDNIYDQIYLCSNYECWVADTNFTVTNSIKDTIKVISGVEILKICSRYRFFVGVGRLFDYSDVINDIEQHIL